MEGRKTADFYDDLNHCETEYSKAKNSITRVEDELFELRKNYSEEEYEVEKLSFLLSSEKQQLDLAKTELDLALSNRQCLEQEINSLTTSLAETSKALEEMDIRCTTSERMIENELNVIEDVRHQYSERYRQHPRCKKVMEVDEKVMAANKELKAAKNKENLALEKLNVALKVKEEKLLRLREMGLRLSKSMLLAKKLRGKTRSVSFVTPAKENSPAKIYIPASTDRTSFNRSLLSGSLGGIKRYPTLKSRFQSHSLYSSLNDKDSFPSRISVTGHEGTSIQKIAGASSAVVANSSLCLKLSEYNKSPVTPPVPLKPLSNIQPLNLASTPTSSVRKILKIPEQRKEKFSIGTPHSPRITRHPEDNNKSPSLLQQTLMRQNAANQKKFSEKLPEQTPVPVTQRPMDCDSEVLSSKNKKDSASAMSPNEDIFGKSSTSNAAEDADEVFSLSGICTDSSLFSPSGFTANKNTGGDNNDIENIFGFSPLSGGFGGPLF